MRAKLFKVTKCHRLMPIITINISFCSAKSFLFLEMTIIEPNQSYRISWLAAAKNSVFVNNCSGMNTEFNAIGQLSHFPKLVQCTSFAKNSAWEQEYDRDSREICLLGSKNWLWLGIKCWSLWDRMEKIISGILFFISLTMSRRLIDGKKRCC